MERASEDDVQRRRVDDEHAEARARDDPREVVVVAHDGLAEGEAELCLDREDLRKGTRKWCEVCKEGKEGKLTLKH